MFQLSLFGAHHVASVLVVVGDNAHSKFLSFKAQSTLRQCIFEILYCIYEYWLHLSYKDAMGLQIIVLF
ncbi:hypothetical protein CDL12_30452 [Handroanthus impetiginosus]|uniref:Uncharacterized protein n=1 Tax=Handroanthus impetiginosus TaxID=429701 RepID=A0A2G9FVG4_9LAMI|nr:hypothetical protein CDL12_30452 [Handroanthus impetiginosus]